MSRSWSDEVFNSYHGVQSVQQFDGGHTLPPSAMQTMATSVTLSVLINWYTLSERFSGHYTHGEK